MAFSIQMSDKERSLANTYAKMHSISVGEAFKRALFEKIEDEYDLRVAEEAYKDYEKNDKKSEPIEGLWKELNI